MTPILIFSTALIALLTLLPLSRRQHWTIRGLDFPRLQFAVFAAAVLIGDFYVLDKQLAMTWVLISITALCLFWHLWWIAPYTPLWQKEVKTSSGSNPAKKLSMITANVLTTNRNAATLIGLVKQHEPDILVTLESDQWWEDQLAVLETDMPYSVKCPLDNLYGMHVYSRLSLEEQEISYLVEDDVPSIHASLTLRSGDKIRMHFLHPAPPSPTENPESTERDAELVIVAHSIADSTQPVIVTGDLNDVAWSATTRLFRKISGLLDPRVGRGMFNTFHAEYPFLRWPLDHVFHSKHFTLSSIQRLPPIGSDHFALLTELAFSPTEGEEQEGLTPEQADHEWSEEIAQEQGLDKRDVPQPGESISQRGVRTAPLSLS